MISSIKNFPNIIFILAAVLLVTVFSLTSILIVIKVIRLLWSDYSKKLKVIIKPVVESYLVSEDINEIYVFKPYSYLQKIILKKHIIYRSFGETDKIIRLISQMYNELGFVELDLKRLGSMFWWTRAEAARCLGQMRVREVKSRLLGVLEDAHVEVRLLSAWALGRIGDPDIIPQCMEALVKDSRLAGMRLSSTVFEIGSKVIPTLIDTLHHGNPEVLVLAIHLLGEMRSAGTVTEIINMTGTDKENEVRIAAYKALGTIGDGSAFEALKKGLKDPLWVIRSQAARGLGLIGLSDAIGALSEAMQDQKWWVRYNAGNALIKLGPAGRDALLQVARDSVSIRAREMAEQWLAEYE